MKRPISISIGPGQGGDLIVDALANAGLLNQAWYTYPDLKIVKYSDSGSSEKVINSFRRLQCGRMGHVAPDPILQPVRNAFGIPFTLSGQNSNEKTRRNVNCS